MKSKSNQKKIPKTKKEELVKEEPLKDDLVKQEEPVKEEIKQEEPVKQEEIKEEEPFKVLLNEEEIMTKEKFEKLQEERLIKLKERREDLKLKHKIGKLTETATKVKCEICNKQINKSSLLRHMKNIHNEGKNENIKIEENIPVYAKEQKHPYLKETEKPYTNKNNLFNTHNEKRLNMIKAKKELYSSWLNR